jgi:4-amino-4-deoxy-L-arabinose transferase-like glycosyltransferase
MNWKNMSLSQKIATVIAGLAVVVWLIAKVQPKLLPFDPTYPAIAVVTICEAVAYWKTKRLWAWLLIGGSVIFIACCILELAM